MRDITVSQGYLYATITEAVLYGCNLTLFIYFVSATPHNNNKGQSASKVVRPFVCLIFILSTAHLAGSICSIVKGFFEQDEPSDSYFVNRALPLSLVNKSLYGATLVIGDLLLIYRVWVIYKRSWKVVVLPILTLLGTMVCAALIVWGLSQLEPGQTIFEDTIMTTAPAMFALPFVTNVMITALIVARIRRIFARGAGLVPATDTICKRMVWGAIESCAIYPVFLLLAIVLYSLKTNVLLLVTGSMTQVVAIVPTLVWLQVKLGYSRLDLGFVGQPGDSEFDVAAPGAGFPAGTIMSPRTLPRSTEFRTGTPQNGNRDRVEEIAMYQLEEGSSNLESRISTERSVAEIETVARTEVTQSTADFYRPPLQGRSSWPS